MKLIFMLNKSRKNNSKRVLSNVQFKYLASLVELVLCKLEVEGD